MMACLKRDLHIENCWPSAGPMKWPATFPAGTELALVDQPMGWAFVIKSEDTVARLTGNPHDARYRYVFVPLSEVEP